MLIIAKTITGLLVIAIGLNKLTDYLLKSDFYTYLTVVIPKACQWKDE